MTLDSDDLKTLAGVMQKIVETELHQAFGDLEKGIVAALQPIATRLEAVEQSCGLLIDGAMVSEQAIRAMQDAMLKMRKAMSDRHDEGEGWKRGYSDYDGGS